MLMLSLFVMGHHLGSGASSLLLPDQKAAKVKKIFGRVLRNKRPGLFANPRKRPLEWGDPACGETCCHAGCCTVEGHPCSCSRVAFAAALLGRACSSTADGTRRPSTAACRCAGRRSVVWLSIRVVNDAGAADASGRRGEWLRSRRRLRWRLGCPQPFASTVLVALTPPWSRALPSHLPVCPVQLAVARLPGSVSRAPVFCVGVEG